MTDGESREQRMVRSLERFFARTPQQRAWRFRLAHRRAGLPEPAVICIDDQPERLVIPWKFKHAN